MRSPDLEADNDVGGFTLVEALVALVIAGLASAAIAGVLNAGLLGHRTSSDVTTALILAEGKLAAVGAGEPLRPGRVEGISAGGFRWELRVKLYDDPEDRPTTSFDQAPSDLRLYSLTAAVSWAGRMRERRLEVSTLRLGPAPP